MTVADYLLLGELMQLAQQASAIARSQLAASRRIGLFAVVGQVEEVAAGQAPAGQSAGRINPEDAEAVAFR